MSSCTEAIHFVWPSPIKCLNLRWGKPLPPLPFPTWDAMSRPVALPAIDARYIGRVFFSNPDLYPDRSLSVNKQADSSRNKNARELS